MRLHHRITFLVNGKERKLTCEEYTRGGSKSPQLLVVHMDGKRYVPFSWKYAGLSLTLHGLLSIIYSAVYFSELIYSPNPFLDLVPKNYSTWHLMPLNCPFLSK